MGGRPILVSNGAAPCPRGHVLVQLNGLVMDAEKFPLARPSGIDPTAIWIFLQLPYGYLGLDVDGSLSAVFPVVGKMPVVGRNAGAIRVDYREDVEISVEDDHLVSNCCIATLHNRTLDRSFNALAESVGRELAMVEGVRARDFSRAIAAWEQLFQRRRRLSLDEEQGLWGELFFLQTFPDFDAAVAAWRGPDADDFDFLANGVAIEVKTSRRFGRHHISHAQVSQATAEAEMYLVSVWVGEDPGRGVTLPALIRTVEAQTQDPVAFEERLLATGYSHADASLYDREFATLDKPAYFRMSCVPKVRAFDPGVMSLSYAVQLDPQLELQGEDEARIRSAFSGLEIESLGDP